MLQKMILGLQRDRYALSERAKLILGMSHPTKKIFGNIFPGRLFLGPINSLAWKFDVQIGENLLIFSCKNENFVNFCEMIEKLKMKQVSKEIEYISSAL